MILNNTKKDIILHKIAKSITGDFNTIDDVPNPFKHKNFKITKLSNHKNTYFSKLITKLGFKLAEGKTLKDNTYDLCLPDGGFVTAMLSKDHKSISILISDWKTNETISLDIQLNKIASSEASISIKDYNIMIKAGYQLEPYEDLCNLSKEDYRIMIKTAKQILKERK